MLLTADQIRARLDLEHIRQAADYAAFRRIMELHANSSNNTVFADSKGTIAYFHSNYIPRRDTTFDTLAGMLEKTLPGFGELFRMLSWEQVGAAAMLSHATAGTYRGSVVVSVPGSPKAVALAWEKLIEPELAHLAWEVGR